MTTTPTSGAADLPEALHRVIDDFERRERGIPQAHIAAALVTELRAARIAQAISKAPDHVAEVGNMVEQAISAEPAGAGYAAWPEPEVHDEGGWHITYYTATMMRDFADRTHALRASHGQAPAQTADFTTLGAAMRAIQQAIELIGAPTDERMRAVRRVLRGAVVVAEDSGDIPALPAPPAMDVSPSAASIAWKALRGLTDPLGELGTQIMGHVRVFAQRQYEAGRDGGRAQQVDCGEDAARWEFRWLNPANNLHVAPSDLGWKTVNSKGMRSEKEVLEDLQAYRYQGKPVYEVRPLFATRALEKPEIRCPVRLANGGDCPRHNLQCGWPDCNKESK